MTADPFAGLASPGEVGESLRDCGYIADRGLATAVYLALAMGRPLFLEGEPGVGKTSLARAVAQAGGVRILRLQCYEGIDAHQALYDWDFARQMLHLRSQSDTLGPTADESSVYDRRFLIARPVLQAIEQAPCVLLIDEIDRADDEFEAFLLEVLSDYAITIPELGTVAAAVPPFVVLTSNRTREVHPALKRRCLYHWLPQPSVDREIQIVRSRVPEAAERLTRETVEFAQRLRHAGLSKPPGVAETIDWVEAMRLLHADRLDRAAASESIGAAIKQNSDIELAVRLLEDATVLAEIG